MYEMSLINDLKKKKCLQIVIEGCVQGVGFRPFVYQLATRMDLTGWVNNNAKGVMIEIEGPEGELEDFLIRIENERPINSSIQTLTHTWMDPKGFLDFTIHGSNDSFNKTTSVLPDMATCSQCLNEILDSGNRRYLYPFTNCTHCGPRYSILEALPYDRVNTSMKSFTMCGACQKEYEDPLNRRFHAQPNACPTCGPHVELWDNKGQRLESFHQAILKTVAAIDEGKIVAMKGVGGFHLCGNAMNDTSVRQLRQRKHREEKPFAVMFPSLDSIKTHCHVSPQEEKLLTSSEAPIVLLLKKNEAHGISSSIAPNNPYLGAMLPYSPFHHIVMMTLQKPMVATSGNLANEPICIDNVEAIERLGEIADVFLVHNRPIVRAIDDSVARVVMDRPYMMRRSRGYAPLPVSVYRDSSVLALGGQLKNTVALSVNKNIFVSQHIGDLETKESFKAFHHTTESLKGLYEPSLSHVACDQHPDYFSSQFARQLNLPVIEVQHHHAHIVSCMAENHLEGEVLGVAFDGTGFGEDQTIWGGEFLLSTLSDFKRGGHLRQFSLPGGEKAIKEPRRSAMGILVELFGNQLLEHKDLAPIKAFEDNELYLIQDMLAKNLNSPKTSSMGRLFDAVASLLDLCQVNRFEGQAAMRLEYILEGENIDKYYGYEISPDDNGIYIVDWSPLIKEIIDDIRLNISKKRISAQFHNTLVEMVVDMAKKMTNTRVVLSGGCFFNKYLTERLIVRLKEENFIPYWHQWIPSNDGGIALGQAVVGMNLISTEEQLW